MFLEFIGSTETSITLRLAGLGNPATSSYYSYIAISKTTSPTETQAIWGSVNYSDGNGYYTANVTFYGLSPGTSYSFRGDATPNGSFMRSEYGTFSTSSPPNPGTPSISLWSNDHDSITLQVTTGANTQYVEFDYYWVDGTVNATMSAGSYGTYYHNIEGLTPNTAYTIDCRATSGGLVSMWSNQVNVTTSPAPTPSVPSINSHSVSGKTATFNITAGTNTDYLYIEKSWESGETIANVTSGGTYNISLTPPLYGTQYWIRVRGENAGTFGSYSNYYYFNTGADTTPPSVSITNHDGSNAITIYWSASDDGQLRASNTYALYISGKGNSTLSFVQYVGLGSNSFTFSLDGNGSPLANGGVYLVRVVATDSYNNTAYSERYVTVTKTRPSNFSWTYAKTSGAVFNLYASEWNGLLDRINEFREYKGFTNITTFNYASPGADFYASQFNQAVNGINSMSPQTQAPPTVSPDDDIYASSLNTLVSSLNSIY